MKHLLVCLFVLTVGTLFLSPARSFAQTKTSEQSLQELVTEVRQLRATLQRMNTTVYKGQVILERFKLQQEQVVRIERELRDTRDKLGDLRGEAFKIKALLGSVNGGVEAGTVKESDRASLKAEMRKLSEREHRVMMRESQLANELQLAQTKLNELNHKLNVLENEM